MSGTDVTINAFLLYCAGRALKSNGLTPMGSHVVPREVLVSKNRDVMTTDGAYLFIAQVSESIPKEWYVVSKNLIPARNQPGDIIVPCNGHNLVTIKAQAFEDTLKQTLAVKDESRIAPCMFNYNYGVLAAEQMGTGPYTRMAIPYGDFYRAEDKLSFGWRVIQQYGKTDYTVSILISGVII